MIENFLAGTATLFGDPFTIGIFVFGVLGNVYSRLCARSWEATFGNLEPDFVAF